MLADDSNCRQPTHLVKKAVKRGIQDQEMDSFRWSSSILKAIPKLKAAEGKYQLNQRTKDCTQRIIQPRLRDYSLDPDELLFMQHGVELSRWKFPRTNAMCSKPHKARYELQSYESGSFIIIKDPVVRLKIRTCHGKHWKRVTPIT